MSNLYEWAVKWNVPIAAVQDLQISLGLLTPTEPTVNTAAPHTEAFAQAEVRLEASQKGLRLFRNNVGALLDENGRMVRYGLANDSAQFNAKMKSSDLIGIRTVIITPLHIGQRIGQFVSREVKRPGWQYTGAEREVAQLAWLNLVTSMGGDAAFTTGRGSL